MNAITTTLAIVRKDLLLELRAKQSLGLMLFLSLLLLVVFDFALDVYRASVARLAPGILWVIFAFSGILGMGRSSMAEQDDAAYLTILLSPAIPESFYLGKVISNFIFLMIMELATLFFLALLFDYEKIFEFLPSLLPPLVLATAGFALIGTLFAFLAAASKYGEILLPFLYLPVVVPTLLGGVSTTTTVLAGQSLTAAGRWLAIMGIFDMLYLAVALLLFQHLLKE